MKKMSMCVAFLGMVLSASIGWAMDFDPALGVATFNIPAGADIASMGNADATMVDFSTNNPAVIGYNYPKDPVRGGASGTFGVFDFSHGPALMLYSASGQVNSEKYGNVQIGYSFADSDTAGADLDADMKFKSINSASVLWGRKFASNVFSSGDDLYFGLGGSYTDSKLDFSVEGENVLRTKSSSSTVTVGTLYVVESLKVGGYYTHSFDRDKEADEIAGETAKDSSGSDQIKVGASLDLAGMTTVAVNYQYLNIDGTGKHQLFAGIEQGIVKDFLYVYGGWAGSGPTAGIGMYFEKGGINLAYMHDPFSDLDDYLGSADVWMATVYWNF